MKYKVRPRNAYQAARFERREELIANEKILADHNIASNTKWLHNAADDKGQETQCDTDEERGKFALMDYENVIDCDFLLYYSEDLTKLGGGVIARGDGFSRAKYVPALWARGGRHVEFGIALASAMDIVVIGPHENIFHWMPTTLGKNKEPQVRHFETLGDFLEWYDDNNVIPDDAE